MCIRDSSLRLAQGNKVAALAHLYSHGSGAVVPSTALLLCGAVHTSLGHLCNGAYRVKRARKKRLDCVDNDWARLAREQTLNKHTQ
eukprot:13614284-Alexandrium_andersonii.AAC.1